MPDTNTSNSSNNSNNSNSSNTDNANNNNSQQTNNSGKEVILGCDSNGVNDAQCQSTIAQIIQNGGYKVTPLGIGPGAYADYSYTEQGKGKLGVYLMAASLVSYLDAGDANFDFNVMGIRGDVTSWGTEEGFKTKGVPKDHHGDCIHPQCDPMQGKTYVELNQQYKPDKVQATWGETPEKLGQNILAALGGQGTSGGTGSSSGGGAVLIPDKTFFGLIKQMLGAVDGIFVVANNMAYLLSFKDFYEYRNQFDEMIPKIERRDVLRDSLVKNWSTDSYYNAVEVTYADGIVKYQNDNLVKQYGENVFYYEFPEDDEETAKAKADALLSAHVRDYSTDIQLSIFFDENITEGSWVKVHKSLTNISGKTLKEIEQDEIKAKGETVSSKRKGLTIENLIEKTITQDDITKTLQVITDEEGEEYEIEIEKTDYELFFVQSYTCRWDSHNSLIMDLELKYGPDTPEDPVNATVGTGGGGDTTGSVGGQSATINEFVQKCVGNSPKQDMATVQKLYDCLNQIIIYELYECSVYSTPDECYKYAAGGGKTQRGIGINCADTSRLVVACYKAAGFQCQVVSCSGHYWNEVMVNGKAQTVDCSSGNTGSHNSHPLGDRLLADVPKSGEHGDNPSC